MMTHSKTRRLGVLFLFVIICLSIGWLGGVAAESSRMEWYADLQKPFLNPPNWVFAPIWTILYIFMAIAGWRIWTLQALKSNYFKFLFFSQLGFNALWSFLFFKLRNPFFGLVDIAFLWVCLFILVKCVWRVDRRTGYFLTPYILWVSFAVYLNAAMWWINR